MLSGIYTGNSLDNMCDANYRATAVFTNLHFYAGWLRTTARELGGFKEENYIQPTTEE